MSTNPALAPPPEVQNPGAVPASPTGEVVGLQSEPDQLGAQREKPLVLRRAIGDAEDFDQLRDAAHGLRRTAVALHDARVGPAEASTVVSTLADSLTRRAIELVDLGAGFAPVPVELGRARQPRATGARARLGHGLRPGMGRRRRATGMRRATCSRSAHGSARCLPGAGLAPTSAGRRAAQDLFVRPASGWRRLIRESISDPEKDKGLIVISLFLDGRVLHHGGGASALREEFQAASRTAGTASPDAEAGPGEQATRRPPARLRPRALGRAPRSARHQARRPAPGDVDRPLREPGGRGDRRRLDAGAAQRRRRRGHARRRLGPLA